MNHMNGPFRQCSVIGFVSCAACGLVLAVSGCSPSQANVKGTVTYQNKPLSSGEVHFISDKGSSRSALIGPLGTFEIKDAPIGEVRVSVVSYKSASGKLKGPSVGKKNDNEEPEEVAARTSAIPTKYNDSKSSELVFTISHGTQTIAIDLKD